MRSVLEYDLYDENITDLGIGLERMYAEADAKVDPDLYEKLKLENLDYYRQLMEKKEQITVQFTGYRDRKNNLREVELFCLFDNVELIYPIKKMLFSGSLEVRDLLDKQYKLYISEIIEEEKLVVLSAYKDNSRKMAYELIRDKISSDEDLYLRGNIIGLQRNSGKKGARMAAYVNIGGLGIIGIIPIKKWSVGYVSTETFRKVVDENINAIVNFRVCAETRIRLSRGYKSAFICSRADYLESVGYNPWLQAEKTLNVGSVVKVKVIEPGITTDSYFATIGGLTDVNALCFIDGRSSLKPSDIKQGSFYYGYVQRMEREKQRLRVRLTSPADKADNVTMQALANDTNDE